MAAFCSPPQHGTSMRTMVTLWISLLLNNLGKLFAVIHIVQLRAADQGHLALQKFLMEVCVSVSGTVCGNEQACIVKVRRADRSQLDLYRPVRELRL